MNLVLTDLYSDIRQKLLPFTYTRPVSELRCGILTLTEKWERAMHAEARFLTEEHLQKKYLDSSQKNALVVAGHYFPNRELVKSLKSLEEAEVLMRGSEIIGFRESETITTPSEMNQVAYDDELDGIFSTHDIFTKNDQQIRADFELLTKGRKSQPIPNSVQTSMDENIFIEKGAQLNHAVLNATDGPIYIGQDAEIMEGSLVRGPLALCEGAVLKMGAKIYGGTTVGPYSKVGGEVSNSVITGYSNKGHDGFLGNSVLGEWCNLGADTNTSNLKNNYAEVRLWDYQKNSFAKTGLTFCGLMMGDHSKCAINTAFNTGTVVGVSANIFGAGFPRNFIPSFTWGGSGGFETYKPSRAYEVANVVWQRRGKSFTETETAILDHVFEQSARYRKN